MKIKLDENLGRMGAELLRAAGHDVATVSEQQLTSAADSQLISVCALEGRCLVTLDLDFSNPFRFPPDEYSGIAVLRLPDRIREEDVLATCKTLIDGLAHGDVVGKLWSVERSRIREYQPELPEEEND